MLSQEERQQIALLAAKIDMERQSPDPEKDVEAQFEDLVNELAHQYWKAMKILSNERAIWNN